MKKILLLLTIIMLLYTYSKAQTWVPVDTQMWVITDISFDNEGNVFLARQNGDLIENGVNIYHFNTWESNEMGLVNCIKYKDDLYLHISGQDTTQKIVRYNGEDFTLDTLISVGYKEPGYSPPYASTHRGGGLIIVDSMLYASFGVGKNPNHAQDLNDYRGKVIAYNLNTGESYIKAFGLRNPFRIDYDRLHNDIWIADDGTTIAEEIDVLDLDSTGMVDFGFPCYEGIQMILDTCESDTIFPIYWYHQDPTRAIIGGAFLNGEYFWADYVSGLAGHVDSLGNNTTINAPIGFTSMAVNPITNKLYATRWTGVVYEFIPDTVILAIDTLEPEDPYVHHEYTDEWIEEMIKMNGGDWYYSMDGKQFDGLPEYPGWYFRLATMELIYVAPKF